ncbi:hypothetical protein MM239_01940 [Belliella sp. DSM 111904]|uniref:Uncharacterized protein n=1 Tax=Belliella filtrata TaxID=2923435 RepID=A0ABS9UVD6_9BACT|nr:hypothetical protein [Belliella filtrata]MCH7408142.1 hypothetical protein [Belliella filtrata]
MLTETPIKPKGRREELSPMPQPLPSGNYRPLINILIIKSESLTTESISHALKDH